MYLLRNNATTLQGLWERKQKEKKKTKGKRHTKTLSPYDNIGYFYICFTVFSNIHFTFYQYMYQSWIYNHILLI